ncbi:uncharacterized protein LOC126395945 [Epinephelus moara]|uniref:uncharacterized protein LOC126395945 n=1 Tax=Epinephelus moara TaxID=300413 RepID=UPI00214EBB61|nr:uncharacterized protein LOC126395945 [Epinephelus moara]
MTLGEKDPNKINKTILLVGETGAGKSTLINALVNYAMGVKWEDSVWFQIVEDERKSQCESQTSDVIVYEIFGFEDKTLPYSLTIIDTPGYGSTTGIEHDAIVCQRLFDLFRLDNGIHEINAVGLVMKATDNRLSDRLRYIFDSVMSLFGKNMEKKIVILITHSDGLTPENVLQALKDAKIKCAKDEENQPLHFMFNNRQSTERTRRNKFALKSVWDVTMEGMSQFTDFLKNTEPQNPEKTIEVLRAQIRLTACIQNLQERIVLTELKQREIHQTQEALKNKEFTVEVDEPYKEKEPIHCGMWGLFFQGAVCCKKCEENCHYPGCTMAWKPGHCEVIKGGRCTSCTGKCPVSDHVKENWIYVTKTKRVKKTLHVNETGSEEKSSLLEDLKKKMEELQRETDQFLEESFNHIIKLEQNALKVNAVSTHVDLDLLIEKMKEKGDTEKVQKLEEIKRRMDEDEGTRSVRRYMSTAGKVLTEVMK